jgi:hypothetical protein
MEPPYGPMKCMQVLDNQPKTKHATVADQSSYSWL